MNDVRSSPRRLLSHSCSQSNSNSYSCLAVFSAHSLYLYISLLVAWGPCQISMTHAYSINVQPIINMHMHQAKPAPATPAAPLLTATECHQNSTHLVESSWLCAHTHRPGPLAAAATVAAASTVATAADPANWRSPHL